MTNLILMIIIIVVGSYYKNKYNREYALPILEENADLSFISKASIIMLLIAGIFAFISIKVTFLILILLINLLIIFKIESFNLLTFISKFLITFL